MSNHAETMSSDTARKLLKVGESIPDTGAFFLL